MSVPVSRAVRRASWSGAARSVERARESERLGKPEVGAVSWLYAVVGLLAGLSEQS